MLKNDNNNNNDKKEAIIEHCNEYNNKNVRFVK